MFNSEESTAASLACLFKGHDTSFGMAWLDSVQDKLSNTSFHHLVVSNGTFSAAKSHDMYGHFWTKTQMKLTPGCCWKEDPSMGLQQDATSFNDKTMEAAVHLDLLRTDRLAGYSS
jgi:hypothetical protein